MLVGELKVIGVWCEKGRRVGMKVRVCGRWVVDGGRHTVCSASKEEEHDRGLYARVAQYSL